MDRQELKADLYIDPEALDVEAAGQAERYGKWAERLAEARHVADESKHASDELLATLDAKIRANPKLYGVESVTEGSVKAAVRSHTDVIASMAAMNNAKLEVALLQAAEEAMKQRKNMIEELIRLFGLQYFAGPRVPRDIGEAWGAYRKRRESEVAGRMMGTVRKRVAAKGG